MADFSNLLKKNRLGAPPQVSEIKNNLQLPESLETSESLIDKRSLRKTGRTHQLATRVKFEFYKRVKRLALDMDITIAELLEKAIDSFEKR
jgi:hypothetical protein